MFGRHRSNEPRTAEDRARAAADRASRRAQRGAAAVDLPADAFADATPPPATAAATRGRRARPQPLNEDTVEYRPFETREHEAGRGRALAVEDPPAPARPAASARRRPAPPRGKHRRRGWWGRRLAAVAAFALIALALFLINAIFQPFHGQGEGAVRVTIPAGAGAGRIGDILAAAGVVDNGRWFQLNATLTGRRGGLRPGTYTLRKGMSNGDVVEALMQGPAVRVVKSFDVTIPEGVSRRELAPLIKQSPVDGDYLQASATRAVLRRIRKLGAPKGTRTSEGFLFPATYTLTGGATASTLVDKQLAAFAENFRQIDVRYAKRKNLTRYDALIIASMVEREAKIDRDRPLIAAVIYNRLKRRMPLAIDATIRYHTNNWQRPIRESELQADEPYNTRLRPGLPPTPIGNPGLASLKAAAKPAHKPYLFFVRKPGSSGEHAFSSTERQFERDVARYQASRGGK